MKAPVTGMSESINFLSVIMTILLQASTARLLAEKLGLLVESQKAP